MSILKRRTLLGAATLPLFAINTTHASAAEFSLKLANNSPVTHPQSVRQQEAADRIKAATNGAVEITLFPNNQLGSDTDMLSQLRSGAIDLFTLSGLILSTLVPPASINGSASPSRTTTPSGRPWTASSAPMCARRSTSAA
jgi:TRAP-type C4-dicarboxylate transport system substrate-binding protein